MELKSLEEPRYLLQQFVRSPLGCLQLAGYATTNTGARRGGGGGALALGTHACALLAVCLLSVMPLFPFFWKSLLPLAPSNPSLSSNPSLTLPNAPCLPPCPPPSRSPGDVARKHIRDVELLRYIDLECYIW